MLKDLVPTDADDLDRRKQLARLLLEKRAVRRGGEVRPAGDRDRRPRCGGAEGAGDALLGQKQADAAIEAYQTALQIDDKSDDARLGLGRAYLVIGDKQRAEAEIGKVLARDPNNPEAKRLRKRLNR